MFAAVIFALAGCPSSDVPSSSPDAGAGEPVLLIGTGSRFEPVNEGDDLPIVAGPQGGHHIFISLRAKFIDPSETIVSFGVRDAVSGRSLSAPATIGVRLVPVDDGWFERPGLLGLLEVPPSEVHQTEVVLWATVQDKNGVRLEDEVRGRAVIPGEDPDAGPTVYRTLDECGPTTGANREGWETFCDDAVGHFLGTWGAAPNDVYMVGGVPRSNGFDGETGIFHFDGNSLSRVPTTGVDRAWWVFGFGPDDIYVSGENGLLLRRDAGGAFVEVDSKTTQTIFGMWGPSPDRLYFVSGDFDSPDGRGRLHVLTSSGAAVIDADVFAAYDGRALFKVWGSSETDVFVVGDRGAVFHFDGTAWARMSTPDDTSAVLTVSGRSSDEVYAVGGRAEARLWKYDGTSWADISPAGVGALMGVHTTTTSPVLVSGDVGIVAAVGDGTFGPTLPDTLFPLHAVWQDGVGGAWAVGGSFQGPGAAIGAVVRRTESACPPGGIQGVGFHHLDLQGRSGTPRADGSYAMFDMARGDIHPALVHGEHYLLGVGSKVEFTIPLCADITDRIAFRIPNNDEVGSEALHELFVVKPDGREILVVSTVDAEPGSSGYLPFDRSTLPIEEMQAIAATNTSPSGFEAGWHEFADAPPFEVAPRDIYARAGDTLLFRTTNVAEPMYGLMVWFPQRGLEYQAFLEIEVPAAPGGETGDPRPPPPVPGPCETRSSDAFVELGRGGAAFVPWPPNESVLELGPQGSLMFLVGVRGRGFSPGSVGDPLDIENPVLLIRLALDGSPSGGGRVIADGRWRRGFASSGADHVLTAIRPTVPVGAANRNQLIDQTIYAEVRVVDASSGKTYCQDTTFTAVAN